MRQIEGQVRGLLARWGDHDAVAADAGVPYVTAAAWFRRRSVPQRYWSALEAGAKRRGFRATVTDWFNAHEADRQQVAA